MKYSKATTSVLIVEDNPEHAELMTRTLESASDPYEVRIASSLNNAIEMIGQKIPSILFVDQGLPDGYGDALISIGKGVFPVVMLTSQGHEQMAVQMIKLGALDYFIKSPELFESLHVVAQRSIREWNLIMDKVYSERKIQDSELWLKEIIESAMDGFLLLDNNGMLIEVNKKYCEMSGSTEEELLSMSIFDLEAMDVANTTIQHINHIMTASEDRFESVHRRRDGSIYHVEISVQYRNSYGGRFIVFLRNISSRKVSEIDYEIKLSEIKNALNQILESKPSDDHTCRLCRTAVENILRI